MGERIMAGLDKEPVDDILKHYPYNIKKIRVIKYKIDKGVWWIHTNKGLKVLKKIRHDEDRFKFILEGIIYLQGQGINIPRIHETIDNELYVNYDGNFYILMEAIDGTRPLYSDKTELKAIITEIAKFHRVSCGFNPSSESGISYCLGRCSKVFTEKSSKLKDYYIKESKRARHTAFGEIAIRELPYFLKRIKYIKNEAAKSKYPLWVEKVSKSGGLGHFDCRRRNLIITPTKETYIFDLDKLSIGLPIWDISYVFLAAMKDIDPFTKQNLKTMINWYQSVNPLTADEWHVVKLNLLYPYRVSKVIKQYKHKKKGLKKDGYSRKLKKAIELDKLIIHNLEGYDHIIDKFI